MAFWGVEVKPGAPHSHRFDKNRGRLHVSQATLGTGSSKKKTLVQCNVGDKSPILLCSLIPEKNETCPLNFEFEEEDEVIFSVLGPQSVHLAGYFLDTGANFEGDEDESDSYGEDIGMSDSERSTDSESNTADEYDDEFSDDDIEMFLPSPKPKSGVVIEEILDDEKPANGNADRKRPKKKKQASDSDAADDQKQIIIGGGSTIFGSESEDEDGLPVSSHSRSKKETAEVRAESGKKVSKGSRKKSEDGDDHTIGAKRKIEDALAGPTKRDIEKANDSHLPSSEVEEVNEEKPAKKKKKERTKKEKNHGNREDNVVDIHQEAQVEEAKIDKITHKEPVRDGADENILNDKGVEFDGNHVADKDTTEKKKKKKKKKKKDKTPESDKSANTEEAGKESVVESEDVKAETKPQKVRSYDNGLVIEELEMGKPATGKRASPGNKVSVHYIGKLKKNGQIFDSNIRGCNAPFQFRLGVGQVIKGWDVGVNGMRIGDKRRLTVPPAMGYGTKGCGPQIPPNAWLVFDVELVAVR